MHQQKTVIPFTTLVATLLLSTAVWAEEMRIQVNLTGNASVPPVETRGSGEGVIVVDENRRISGSVATKNIDGTMAHIHHAPPDANGPVAIPLEQTDKNVWSVPENTQLTDAQYESLKNGDLYINVHTKENPAGEIRGQLKP